MSDRPDGSPTAVDVVLRPEWAAVQATDKSLYVSGVNVTWGNSISVSYNPAAGKTFYVTQIAWLARAEAQADGDLNQFSTVNIIDGTNYYFQQGGNGGGGSPFPKPITLPHLASGAYSFVCACLANHAQTLALSVGGYEI